jgi:exosome complex component CSL4
LKKRRLEDDNDSRINTGKRAPTFQSKFVLPGDNLGAEEEFEPGLGSTSLDGKVVASVVGEATPNMSSRVMLVKPAKHGIAKLPEVNDVIIGTIQSAASSIAQVRIDAINDIRSTKDLSGMLSMRDDRHRRNSPPIKAGDVVRAKVSSTVNSIYHLSLDCSGCGVIYTVCSFCGGRVVALGRGAVKCTECGSTDDRLLSDDFVTYSRTEH